MRAMSMGLRASCVTAGYSSPAAALAADLMDGEQNLCTDDQVAADKGLQGVVHQPLGAALDGHHAVLTAVVLHLREHIGDGMAGLQASAGAEVLLAGRVREGGLRAQKRD